MKTESLDKYIRTVNEALRAFLSTLLGSDASLLVEEPSRADLDEANQLGQGNITFTAGTSKDNQWAVVLEAEWLPLLSKSMLGEPIGFGDPGSEDLLRELAAQAYGAVRTQLSAEGASLPDVQVQLLTKSEELVQERFAPILYKVPFKLQADGSTPGGYAIVPQPGSSAAETSGKERYDMPLGIPETEKPKVEVAPAAFPELGNEVISGDGADGGFELLAEVELEVTAELGRRKIPLSDVLRLTTGSVIELEKLVGEPLEVYANGRLIAEGEAVVMDEQFGIRITNLASGRNRARAFV